MANISFRRSLFSSNPNKYISFLAGNAAYIPTAFDSIATATGTGSSDSITFSSIPSTYKHLQLRIMAKGTFVGSTSPADLAIRVNSDSGSNYSYHVLNGNGSSASAGNGVNQGDARMGVVPQSSATQTNMMGAAIIDIYDYSSTSKNKTFRSFSGTDLNGSGLVTLNSGLWINTSAINSIILFHYGDYWTTTSTFALYGIKG